MRKHNLISLIYANLEKTSTAVEAAAQTNSSPATPIHGCRCDRWGHPAPLTPDQQFKQQLPSSSILLAK